MSNKVVHFEIPCDNPEKTISFFKEAFGWNFQQFGPEPYWMAYFKDPDGNIHGIWQEDKNAA